MTSVLTLSPARCKLRCLGSGACTRQVAVSAPGTGLFSHRICQRWRKSDPGRGPRPAQMPLPGGEAGL